MEDKQIKVALIPDNTRIVSNKGKKDYPDLSIGTKIEIFEISNPIIDPDSGDIIDYYGKTKEQLEITNLYDNYFVARKVNRINKSVFNFNAISPLLVSTEKSYKDLNVKFDQVKLSNETTNYAIQSGDPIRFYYK